MSERSDSVEKPPTDATATIERPVGDGGSGQLFGSDPVADALRELDVPYVALNPGASYRGLHDSLVNRLGNERPQMLMCLHEEHAVAIAHGYAKVTGRPMAAAVHSNVGLMHATMAIFNAWCDRMPVIVLGATGPLDAVKRRPWIDWIHTSRDQAAMIRPYIKFDDQPGSPEAARDSLYRAAWLAKTAPCGPVYIALDAELQEQPLERPVKLRDPARWLPVVASAPSAEQVRQVAAVLRKAKRPLILAGRVSRSPEGWARRVRLAEMLGARVATDLKVGAAFPTSHPLHVGAPAIFPEPALGAAIRDADVILSLDWVDLGGTLKVAYGDEEPRATIVQASLDHQLHNGWSMDHQGHPPVDHFLPVDGDALVGALLDDLNEHVQVSQWQLASDGKPTAAAAQSDVLTVAGLAAGLTEAVGGDAVSLLHLPLSWDGAQWDFEHPLDYLGGDGGGGIGGGPGISIGAALALKGSGRLPISVIGDGDFLMGATAVWTACHYRIPLLFVVANNASFYNDEVHQERMAVQRGRPVENKWIGQRIADPEIDIATLASAQGAQGFGPVTSPDDLRTVLAEAIAATRAGRVAVVDVRVATGYTPAMASQLK